MAETKMSQMAVLNNLDALDQFFVLDKSDTTDSLQGTLKRMQLNTLLEYLTANYNPLVQNTYLTITDMLADQSNQTSGRGQFVSDASLDPTVTSGSAFYEYLGTENSQLSDYRKLSEDEVDVLYSYEPFNKVIVSQIEETSPSTVQETKVAVQFEELNITNLVFNLAYSSFLENFVPVLSDHTINVKLFNQTNGKTLIAEVDSIVINSNYAKVSLKPGALVANISENDVLMVELDFDSKQTNLLIQKFTVDAVQNDTTPLTSSSIDKIGVEYNDGTGNVSAFLFNEDYTSKLSVIAEYVATSNLQIQLYNYTTEQYYTCKILSFEDVGVYKRANICDSMVNDFLVNDVIDFQVVVSNVESFGGGIINQQIPFTSTVVSDKKYFSTNTNRHTQTSDIFFSVDNTNAVIDGGYTLEIIGNGSKLYFTSDFGIINSSEVVTDNFVTLQDGVVYLIVMFYTGNSVNVMIGESNIISLQQLNQPIIADSVWDSSTDATLTITDTNTNPNEDETDVEYSISGADSWTVHGQMLQDATSYTVTGLDDTNSYDFRVKAKITSDYFSNSDYSEISILLATTSNVILFDDFNDNSIDVSKWSVVGSQGKITEVNQRLEFNFDHSTTISGNNLDHYIKAVPTFNSGKLWFQFDLEQENVLSDNGIIHIGLYKTSDGDNTNCARLITDTTNSGKLKAQIFLAGTKVYEVSNLGTATGTYKIGYDIATNNITFWQLTGVDTWTQLGTTQTYDIIGDELTETITCLIAMNDNTIVTSIDYAYIDNVYISTADYSTSNPI